MKYLKSGVSFGGWGSLDVWLFDVQYSKIYKGPNKIKKKSCHVIVWMPFDTLHVWDANGQNYNFIWAFVYPTVHYIQRWIKLNNYYKNLTVSMY